MSVHVLLNIYLISFQCHCLLKTIKISFFGAVSYETVGRFSSNLHRYIVSRDKKVLIRF